MLPSDGIFATAVPFFFTPKLRLGGATPYHNLCKCFVNHEYARGPAQIQVGLLLLADFKFLIRLSCRRIPHMSKTA